MKYGINEIWAVSKDEGNKENHIRQLGYGIAKDFKTKQE